MVALAQLPGGASLPFIQSDVLPTKTVVALDASDFASGSGDTAEFSVTDDATVVPRDDPTPITDAAGGRGTPTVSFGSKI